MHDQQRQLLHGLGIVAVNRDGNDVVVSLYGGPTNVCGTVRFSFPDRRRRARSLATLRRWARSGEVVSLLRNGTNMSLFTQGPAPAPRGLPAA